MKGVIKAPHEIEIIIFEFLVFNLVFAQALW